MKRVTHDPVLPPRIKKRLPQYLTERLLLDHRGHDEMGNRVYSGRTGDFVVRVMEASRSVGGDENETPPLATTVPVYAGGGEYKAEYNVSKSGEYSLHVRFADVPMRP